MTFSCGTRVEGPGAFDEVAIVLSFSPAWVSFVPDRLLGFVASDIKLVVVSSNFFSLSSSSGLSNMFIAQLKSIVLELNSINGATLWSFSSSRRSFFDLFDCLFQLFLRVTVALKSVLWSFARLLK